MLQHSALLCNSNILAVLEICSTLRCGKHLHLTNIDISPDTASPLYTEECYDSEGMVLHVNTMIW